MKNSLINLLIKINVILLLIFTANAFAEAVVSDGYEKLKALAGEWSGTLPDGKPIEISYQIINGGAVLERYRSKDPMWWNMSTAYHINNDQIIMSHYCSWGNHPRMKTSSTIKKITELNFDFIDLAENEPENGHMRDLTIKFIDVNHMTHHWVWREDGKDTPLVLTLVRK